MTDSFKDKFVEIAALWKSKKGSGFSGTLNVDALPLAAPDEIQVLMWENKSQNPKAPKWKLYIERPPEQPRIPTEKDNIEDDQVPF